MTYSDFYRTQGAKDKRPRKRRKKTRLEASVQRKVERLKRPFEPEPNMLEKAVEVVKDNPGKVVMGALTTAAVIATKGKQIAKGIEAIRGIDLATIAQKNERYRKLIQVISKAKAAIDLKVYKAKERYKLYMEKKIADQKERALKAEEARQALVEKTNTPKSTTPKSTTPPEGVTYKQKPPSTSRANAPKPRSLYDPRPNRRKRNNFFSPVTLAAFARTRGAKDNRRRKKRYRIRAVDSDKIRELGKNEVIREEKGIDPKVKEAYLRAQTFRSRLNPIIYGIREARSTINMINRMSSWKTRGKSANFRDYGGWPVVEDMEGKQIKGQGGIVKILAHLISSDKTYALEYKPKKYNSKNRYYERYATLLADNQGNVQKAKDVGGKPDHQKSSVKGQMGIEAKKGKVSGSLLTRQYSSDDYSSANFEESRIERLRERFRKLASKGKSFASKKYGQAKEYTKENYPKAKAYAKRKYGQAKEKVKDMNIKRKMGTAALKTAYHTGRYAEKASRAKKRIAGD